MEFSRIVCRRREDLTLVVLFAWAWRRGAVGRRVKRNGMWFPVAGRDDDESAVLLARGGVGGGDGGGCDGSVYSCGGASSIGVGVGGATSAGEARGLC